METAVLRSHEERRRSTRFDLTLQVRILKLRNEAVEISSETLNLSSVGAYFPFDDELAPGVPLEFMVTLPAVKKGASPDVLLRCRGHVSRADALGGSTQFGIAATIDRYQFVRQDPS